MAIRAPDGANKKTWKTNVLRTMRNKDLRFFSSQKILKLVEYF